MRGVIVFFAVLFIVLLLVITGMYFYFEKPKQDEINMKETGVNFTIYATENGKYIKTGYIIKADGITFSQGETLADYPIIVEVPTNRTIIIYNVNEKGQTYYTTVYQKTLLNFIDNQRVELKLTKPGSLLISNDKNIGDDKQILMNISSTSNFNKPYLCIKWSTHVISVTTVYKEVPKLKRYELYDRCYNFDRMINNESFNFPINYKTFGTLDDNDFIKLAFIDSDCINSICDTSLTNDINESIDIGATDILYELKK